MPIELICEVCARPFSVPPSRTHRVTCSPACYTELRRRRGFTPALRAATEKRAETDGDPEVRRRRYGHWRGKDRSLESKRKTSETLRTFHRERGMLPLGSTRIDANGYVNVLVARDTSEKRRRKRATDGAVWRYIHDVIMEGLLGRPLAVGECVHHADGNRRNNAPENLRLMLAGEHVSLHLRERWAKKRAGR